jgi:5-methylcytosine-specific restriction endonuclease McrA
MLVDAFDQGNYTADWQLSVVDAFLTFKQEVAAARLHHRETRESLPHYERFGRLLSGSGSDTAEVIRIRHAFMLSELYPKLSVKTRDPRRGFDSLEREVIWNRDRGQCQSPGCPRPDRKVAFRESTIHHIVEHSAGGQTSLKNGILICPECHTNRADMQQHTEKFQEYIARIYSRPDGGLADGIMDDYQPDLSDEWTDIRREGIKIEINWGDLDIDRPSQEIQKGNDTETIVELLKLLLDTFKKSMRQQLMEIPIVRYPLSTEPMRDFLNRAQNRPYSYTQIPGTDLYFCGHSNRAQKLERLNALFSRLTLPDGSEFPDHCISVTVEAG